MSRGLLLGLSMSVALVACGTEQVASSDFAVPSDRSLGFGVSAANPRDLPAMPPRAEGRRGAGGGTVFEPISAPIVHGVPYRFSLGHCGLVSPVDVDGSFWDARQGIGPGGGELDLDTDGEMINATAGVILVAGEEMRFRTASGSVVRFERHHGEKEFEACD